MSQVSCEKSVENRTTSEVEGASHPEHQEEQRAAAKDADSGNEKVRLSATVGGGAGGRKRPNRRRFKGGRNHRKSEQRNSILNREEAETQYMEKRRRMEEAGIPLSPMNTTQYLIEQHRGEQQFSTPNLSKDTYDSDSSSTGASAFDYDNSYLAKEFDEAYDVAQNEKFHCMSRDDLVKECIAAQQRLNLSNQESQTLESLRLKYGKLKSNFADVNTLNQNLISENVELRRKLSSLKGVQAAESYF